MIMDAKLFARSMVLPLTCYGDDRILPDLDIVKATLELCKAGYYYGTDDHADAMYILQKRYEKYLLAAGLLD